LETQRHRFVQQFLLKVPKRNKIKIQQELLNSNAHPTRPIRIQSAFRICTPICNSTLINTQSASLNTLCLCSSQVLPYTHFSTPVPALIKCGGPPRPQLPPPIPRICTKHASQKLNILSLSRHSSLNPSPSPAPPNHHPTRT
jgi:hypothetical protein